MELKRAKVINLLAKDEGMFYWKGTTKIYVREHLYFITDDKPKDEDWCINSINNVVQFKSSTRNKKLCKKIVATTDKTLIKESINAPNGKALESLCLPQPSEAFIKRYCEVGGIDEVDIEYLRSSDGYYDENNNWHWKLLAPKVDSNNNIIIHPIKNSWSREEVKELILKLNNDKEGVFDASKWIEENLK